MKIMYPSLKATQAASSARMSKPDTSTDYTIVWVTKTKFSTGHHTGSDVCLLALVSRYWVIRVTAGDFIINYVAFCALVFVKSIVNCLD